MRTDAANIGRGAKAKRPRTASRATRRRQLIEATIDSIAAHGISGTTMASVTGRADLSLGIVGFHFQSKENLMRETLIFLAREHRDYWIRALNDPGLTPAEKLRAVVEANFHPDICTKQRISVWFAFFGEAKYRAIYKKKIGHYDTERSTVIARICSEIIAEGGYDAVDPSAVATSIECLADGLWLSLLVSPENLKPATAQANIYRFLAQTFPEHFPVCTFAPVRVRA